MSLEMGNSFLLMTKIVLNTMVFIIQGYLKYSCWGTRLSLEQDHLTKWNIALMVVKHRKGQP